MNFITSISILSLPSLFSLYIVDNVSVSAFTLPVVQTATAIATIVRIVAPERTTTMLYQSVDPRGWDNDNYMDALNNAGTDEDAIERANDEYFRKSRYGRPDEYDWGDDDVVTVTTKNYDNNNHNQQQQQRSCNQQQYQQQQQHQQQSPPTSSFPHTNPMTSYADSMQLQYQQPQPQQTSSYNSYSNPGDELYDDTTNADALVKEIGGTSTVAGAPTFTDTMKEKAKSSHNDQEAAAQGGSRFMELMQRSQDQQYKRQQQSQSQQGNTITITTPTMIMTHEEISNLSIEGQARLYREFYYTQQQQQRLQPS